ncbi:MULTISPECIES: AAA family ATPase [Planktothrix]|uniref:AAA family ATPase n=1 Tax=Planktothrix TaxID=54304 RepID=UPI00041D9CBC|nr:MULTISPECIES: AAA family ATPase [Planktothrix]CAD0227907.1 SMC domain protein [Planktothrix agardhii]CAD5972660.1 SMC domain protein [Planktothrix rubescens]CAD5978238.1 SMC domain protein [Planktothrix agardhii]
MIQQITIKNFKSIDQLKLPLGRVTVLIGENGCGKTNILEAIALSSAAASDKLDHEFLASRGIRITEPQFMRSAFNSDDLNKEIETSFQFQNDKIITYNLQHDGKPYSSWVSKISEISKEIPEIERMSEGIYLAYEQNTDIFSSLSEADFVQQSVKRYIIENPDNLTLKNFLIFSPENSSLRIFKEEGQIQPLGIHGEGLLKLLTVLNAEKNQEKIQEIKEKMQLIDWFKDFSIPDELSLNQKTLKIADRYLISRKQKYFDQNSSNEGFLFLLFYFCLFISDNTPKFFAVDNIDVSLNPRLGRRLVQELVQLAKKYERQVIFTTHNPAILDGLDLEDDEQRLFVISRNQLGYTKARRILSPKPLDGQEPVRLSEAFLRGYIGGLPKNF